MKVYVAPPSHLSQAMFRVARALVRYAPEDVVFVEDEDHADLLVHHVIGTDAVEYMLDKPCAVIQYCVATASDSKEVWGPLWSRARLVWSYYDLSNDMPSDARFYLAPLGIDPTFVECVSRGARHGVVTSGYVSHPRAEAIEEVALAASALGIPAYHLGPKPEGMEAMPPGMVLIGGITDKRLSGFYGVSHWVSGLRHVEGFEMPCIEGLACGARPIVFDRPDMHLWYNDHAIFIPEMHGEPLVDLLTSLMRCLPAPVTHEERQRVLKTFNWETIVTGFWTKLLENV